MDPTMLAILIGVLVAAVGVAVVLAFSGQEQSGRSDDRLDALVGKGGNRKDSSADLLLKAALAEVDRKTILDAITPEFLNVKKICEQAEVNVKPSVLFGISIGLALFGGMLSVLIARTIYVAPVGAIVLAVIPWVWLIFKRNARLKAFATMLPDALELIARALRAGHSLQAGMHVVAEEMPPPISKEFGRVYEEQNLGVPLEEALKNLANRIPNLDLRFFVTAVSIQRQTGGDLAEILDKIGYVIRERYKILGMVKALTAEGRMSGLVLSALPFGLFGLMLHMKPDYISMLWTEPLGIQMSVYALISQLVGAIVIKKIVDIKV